MRPLRRMLRLKENKMYQVFCLTCNKITVHIGVQGKNTMKCFQCKEEQLRPQPDTTGWTKREKEIWKVLFRLICQEDSYSVKRIMNNMPHAYAYNEWEVRNLLEKLDMLGTEA